MINSTENYNEGRFGNQFIRNMACHFIAKKNNLFFTYENPKNMELLGISLFKNGNNYYSQNIVIDDNNFFEYINPETPILKKNIKFNKRTTFSHNREIFYAQTNQFAKYLFSYFQQSNIKQNIIANNIFKENFGKNNNLFIHVRLGDVPHYNSGFDYYDNILSNNYNNQTFNYSKGYISSDSIEHEICQKLIQKYDLEIINKNEIETIMFSSTCKTILLSTGTFSWIIGLFGSFFNSKIFYPIPEIPWHGDIFSPMEDWNGIKLSKKYNYVINLDRRIDRYNNFLMTINKTKNFKNENFIRFSAFDGNNFYNELKRFNMENMENDPLLLSILKNNSTSKNIKTGELGLVLSYLQLFLEISKNNNIKNDDYVKIFEDDIFLENNFDENYQNFNKIISENSHEKPNFIYLGGRFTPLFEIDINNESYYEKKTNSIYKRRPVTNPGHNIHWDRTTCSYMIKKSYAKELYNIIIKTLEENQFMAIDNLYLYIHDKYDFYDIYPHLFWSPLNYNSDIQVQSPKYINLDFLKPFPIKIISLIGFWENFDINNNIFTNKIFKNNSRIRINNNNIYESNIIIVGSFINETLYRTLIDIYKNYKNIDLILYITEPIGNYFNLTYKLYQLNIFKKVFGCIIFQENISFKYPIYLNIFKSIDEIKAILDSTNHYVKSISLDDKLFCTLVNRHDDGNTRSNIYHLLKQIDSIKCPGKLFNNCPNSEINELGNIEYIKKFLFNICPENFRTQFNGYITEKLLNCCLGGAIPIFFGHFDEIDTTIFNKNRIIFFDPFNKKSMNDTFIFVKDLYENKDELEIFYRQNIFENTAYETIMMMENNLSNFLSLSLSLP